MYFSVGHGNGDVGAVATHQGKVSYEFSTCKAVLDRAKVIMKAQGVNVEYVPLDLSLPLRIKWVNANVRNDMALVELHMNAAAASATGAEMFYYRGNAQSEGLADQLLKAYCKSTGLRSRGVKPDTATRHKRLGIIADVRCRSTLIELGFITNKEDLDTVIAKGALGLANIALSWHNKPFLSSFGEKQEEQKISGWAAPSVKKSVDKGIILDWSRPQDLAEPWWMAHILYKLGGLTHAEGPLTKERVAKALDTMGLLD
jgi:N-acetylmuramoyl-L-alanine amidase